MEPAPWWVYNAHDFLLLAAFSRNLSDYRRQDCLGLASVELDLRCCKLLFIQLDVLLRIFNGLFNKFNSDDALGALAETKPDRTCAAADVKESGLLVDACEVGDQREHLLEDKRVHLEKGEGGHRELEPAKELLIVVLPAENLPLVALFVGSAEVVSHYYAQRGNGQVVVDERPRCEPLHQPLLYLGAHSRHWVRLGGLAHDNADQSLLSHLRLSVKQNTPEALARPLVKRLQLLAVNVSLREDYLLKLSRHDERLLGVDPDIVRFLHKLDALGQIAPIKADTDRSLSIVQLINTFPGRCIHPPHREFHLVPVPFQPVRMDDLFIKRELLPPRVKHDLIPGRRHLTLFLDFVVQILGELGQHIAQIGVLLRQLLSIR